MRLLSTFPGEEKWMSSLLKPRINYRELLEERIEMDRQDFGKKFRLLRKSRGWTIKHCAEVFGVSTSAIHSWEIGHMTPELARAKVVAQVFNVSLNDLIDLREPPEGWGKIPTVSPEKSRKPRKPSSK
jgi:DNA-binding XRE family transcriptional regulator